MIPTPTTTPNPPDVSGSAGAANGPLPINLEPEEFWELHRIRLAIGSCSLTMTWNRHDHHLRQNTIQIDRVEGGYVARWSGECEGRFALSSPDEETALQRAVMRIDRQKKMEKSNEQ